MICITEWKREYGEESNTAKESPKLEVEVAIG